MKIRGCGATKEVSRFQKNFSNFMNFPVGGSRIDE
jgi:hypothetical protein